MRAKPCRLGSITDESHFLGGRLTVRPAAFNPAMNWSCVILSVRTSCCQRMASAALIVQCMRFRPSSKSMMDTVTILAAGCLRIASAAAATTTARYASRIGALSKNADSVTSINVLSPPIGERHITFAESINKLMFRAATAHAWSAGLCAATESNGAQAMASTASNAASTYLRFMFSPLHLGMESTKPSAKRSVGALRAVSC